MSDAWVADLRMSAADRERPVMHEMRALPMRTLMHSHA